MTSQEVIDKFISTSVDCSYQYQRIQKSSKNILTDGYREAPINLRNNKDVLVTRPDKGSEVVLSIRPEYAGKVSHILSDQTKFTAARVEKERTKAIEDHLTVAMRKMKDQNLISSGTYEQSRSADTTIPHLYGRRTKFYKPGISLRPIVNMTISPYQSFARWLIDLLEPVRTGITHYSLKDTFHLAELIKERDMMELKMTSVDVTSLITNVPILEKIVYLCQYITVKGITRHIPVA